MLKLFALEGNRQSLDGGAMFGHAPKALWNKWYPADEANRIELACRALLIQTPGHKNILCETGIGDFFDPKLKERYGVTENGNQLIESLKKIKLHPNDIHALILSHLHFDHAGGLLSNYNEGEPRLVFENATFYVSRTQWERALNPHPRDKASYIPVIQDLLKKSKRLVLLDDTHLQIPEFDFLDFRISNGHTPGLLHTVVKHSSGPVFFAADLIPGLPWMPLAIGMGYDRCAETLMDEKAQYLTELLNRKGFVFFTHDIKTALAKVCRDERGAFFGEASNEILKAQA